MAGDFERLKKALLVALSSDKDGEVLAALKVAKKQLASAGKDIYWLVDRLGSERASAPAYAPPRDHYREQARQRGEWSPDWPSHIMFLSQHAGFLRQRELDFVLSLTRQWQDGDTYWQPSPRQGAWLSAIHERVKQQTGDR